MDFIIEELEKYIDLLIIGPARFVEDRWLLLLILSVVTSIFLVLWKVTGEHGGERHG